jgi:hypothetical protein
MICAPIVNDTIAIENGKYNPMNHNYSTKDGLLYSRKACLCFDAFWCMEICFTNLVYQCSGGECTS